MIFKEHSFEGFNKEQYHSDLLKISRDYTQRLFKEVGTMIKCVAIFGSLSKDSINPDSDVDLLIVIDDTYMELTPEILDAFRIISEKLILEVSQKLHVHTLTLSGYWNFIREGDPVMINILRDGYSLLDTGIFLSMQKLLYQGKIRPSTEAVYNYVKSSAFSILTSDRRLLESVVDLYWAAINVTHAYLMFKGELPSSPEQLDIAMKKYKIFSSNDISLLKRLYSLYKDITNSKLNLPNFKEFESLRQRTVKYHNKVRKELRV